MSPLTLDMSVAAKMMLICPDYFYDYPFEEVHQIRTGFLSINGHETTFASLSAETNAFF